ncbi:hypothetical protein SAMD00024442_52_11 [Candidatus Symbiothrix dinenymphae]|nr:hypothetical protein SAMD00024442_52_11 [Candidatus Symbiothrix dinenymphae]
MNNFSKMAILLLIGVVGVCSCAEGERFAISSDDTTPPSPPRFDSVVALPGGAEIFYKIPADEDVISIEASFTATNGELIKSAVSFFAHSLKVYGLPDTLEHTLQLYALDRAGNKSTEVPVKVKPLEPTYSRVANSLKVYPAFSAILLTWDNELEKDVNLYVDFSYSDNGTPRSIRQVFSSNKIRERQFINDLNLPASEAVSVQVTVEDLYGNRTNSKDFGQIHLKTDTQLDKNEWTLPNLGVWIGGVAMGDGNRWEGANRYLIDGLINDEVHPGNVANFHPSYVHFMIDLGAKYELSRIVTHQRRSTSPDNYATDPRGELYLVNNVGIYEMYYWDGDDDAVNDVNGEWKEISQIKIPMPEDAATVLDIIRMATLGDESLMYPDSAKFTPPTRWFRYKAIAPFNNNYGGSMDNANSLSEITLYGNKKE